MAKGSFRMKPIKIPVFLLTLSVLACTDSNPLEHVRQSSNDNQQATNVSESMPPVVAEAPEQAISEKISELETRRLELEVKRLAAEELRLAAAEQSLRAVLPLR